MCAISYFLIFSGQFWASGNSTPGPSEAEKLIGWGKKNRDYLQKNGLESIQKNVSGTGDVSQGLCLSKLKKNCIYGNQGLINNLRAESI